MNTLRLSDYKDKLIHFIGIGGSSMSGLAELRTALGYQVRGDDRSQSHSTDKLIREGIPVVIGHDAKNVHGAGLVVYTAAIAPDNVERMECEHPLPTSPYPQSTTSLPAIITSVARLIPSAKDSRQP